jgi:hypothetical protein
LSPGKEAPVLPRVRRSVLAVLAGGFALCAVTVAAAVDEVGEVTLQAARVPVAHTPPAVAPKVAERNALPTPELCVGAAAMTGHRCPRSTRGPVAPTGNAASTDWGPAYHHDCVTRIPWDRAGYRRCVYFGGKQDRTTANIALVGNSHSVQYLPTILVLAAENHWRVTTYLTNKCFPNPYPLDLSKHERDNCLAWGKWVMQDTDAGHFDLVITSNRQGESALGHSRADSDQVWRKGYSRYVRSWLDSGTRVLVIRDNPYPGHTGTVVPDCVALHRKDWRACSGPRAAWLEPDPLAEAALAAHSPRAQVADLTPMFCTSTCEPVIGNTMVYRDQSHITATYARTLAPYLAPYVKRALTVGVCRDSGKCR